jgi:putative spermidine/putrescine transport system permease protein
VIGLQRRRQKLDPWRIGLGVFTLVFALFIMAPLVVVIVVSFSASQFLSFPVTAWSLKWYGHIFAYQPFVDGLITSFELAFASTALGTVLGVPAALALGRRKTGWAGLITLLLLSPISIPALVLGFALLYYLSALHLGSSFVALLIAHTVVSVPYVTRTVLAVYRANSPVLEEAAAVLGAGRWNVFRHITLPLIKPGIFAGGLFAVLISLDNLPLSFFFGSASTNTLPVVMLSYLQNQFDPSVAAVSTVQMVIALVLLLAVERAYGIKRLISA